MTLWIDSSGVSAAAEPIRAVMVESCQTVSSYPDKLVEILTLGRGEYKRNDCKDCDHFKRSVC